jgi:hypothetical protein
MNNTHAYSQSPQHSLSIICSSLLTYANGRGVSAAIHLHADARGHFSTRCSQQICGKKLMRSIKGADQKHRDSIHKNGTNENATLRALPRRDITTHKGTPVEIPLLALRNKNEYQQLMMMMTTVFISHSNGSLWRHSQRCSVWPALSKKLFFT